MLRNWYRTQCGGRIVVSLKCRDHLQAHPEVADLLDEAIGQFALPRDGSFLAREVNLGRVVGRSGCVPAPVITPATPAMFAMRIGREKPSRVVIGEGIETTTVVVLAFAGRDGDYVLITSWIGSLAPKEPWDTSMAPDSAEAGESLDFWSRHALVHDPEVMGETFESSWQEIINS